MTDEAAPSSRAECRGVAVPALSAGGGGAGEAETQAAGLHLPVHLSASGSQLIGHLTAQLTVALKVTAVRQ